MARYYLVADPEDSGAPIRQEIPAHRHFAYTEIERSVSAERESDLIELEERVPSIIEG